MHTATIERHSDITLAVYCNQTTITGICIQFTKDDFIPSKDTNGSIDKVKNIDIAFGLWNYDTTQSELEIEISKFEIVIPADNSK